MLIPCTARKSTSEGNMKYLEILFWKFARRIIENGYNTDCGEYEELCASCRATKTVEWIEEHIDLLRWNGKNP